MKTEYKSAEEILEEKFPNAKQLDWFIPIKECMEAYHAQFKQPDISEDVVGIIADNLYNIHDHSGHHLMDTGKCDEIAQIIFNELKEWQGQQPIPTVDEDELWNKIGAILNGSVSFSMYPKYLATIKQQFSITRK